MRKYRTVPTEQFRFRLARRLFGEPLVVLQMEKREEQLVNEGYSYERWTAKGDPKWVDAQLEDLTAMSLDALISPRDGGEMPTCFKPRSSFGEWSLVLQVLEGGYEHGTWREARVQDLVIRDGRIQGGLGLMKRSG